MNNQEATHQIDTASSGQALPKSTLSWKTRPWLLLLSLLLLLGLGLGCWICVFNQGKSFASSILNERVKYEIYLPDDYENSGKDYPVLYLLHGLGASHRDWQDYCEMIDEHIKKGELKPLIVVMPNAKRTWYVNDYKGENRYEDMFFTEFLPYIEATYRIKDEQQFRIIAGISMGGHGALIYTLHHPEQFGLCITLSAAVYRDEDLKSGRHRADFTKRFGPELETAQVSPHWMRNNALYLIPTLADSDKGKLRFFIDCGDRDWLLPGNERLQQLMQEHQYRSEFRVGKGGHHRNYWLKSFNEVLKFIARTQD